MEFTPAMYEGEPCLQVIFCRQEADPQLAREVEELRQRDQVTGLFNRQTFLHSLEDRSEEHTSELQSLMRISYAVFCLKKQIKMQHTSNNTISCTNSITI